MEVKINIPDTSKVVELIDRHERLVMELKQNLAHIERESMLVNIDLEKVAFEHDLRPKE